jgi:uncharacterized damage-inducible protein DinB
VWFERRFATGVPPAALPDLIERLRGTPARLEERLRGVDPARATLRIEGRWSIQENAGHLGDLEPLWSGRLDDFDAGEGTLRAADLQNRVTHDANHNAARLGDVLTRFRSRRAELVMRLESIDAAAAARTALHPRLQQPMTVADLCAFVAEHDDHHLAAITELLRVSAAGTGA